MYKKLIIGVALLMTASFAQADNLDLTDMLEKMPELRSGVAYSVADSQFNYIGTIDLINYKWLNVEFGYSGRAKSTKDKAVVVASVKLLEFNDFIKFRPGIYAGWGRITGTNEFDYGVSASILEVKF